MAVAGNAARLCPLSSSPHKTPSPHWCVAAPARTGAMVSLAQELPPVILARLTGLSITNAIRWTEAVAASNARYASFLVDR